MNGGTESRSIIKEYILPYALPVLAAAVLFKIVFMLVFVPSGSMEPTLRTGSLHLVWHLPWVAGDKSPCRGDIAVFYSAEEGSYLIKRVKYFYLTT